MHKSPHFIEEMGTFRINTYGTCLEGKETIEVGVDSVRYGLESLGVVAELARVAVDDEQRPLVGANPLFVELVEALQVVNLDRLLVGPSALLYLLDEVGDAAAYVYHEVGQLHQRHHEVEELAVVGKVAVAHEALVVEVGCKDAGILEAGAVLYDVFL